MGRLFLITVASLAGLMNSAVKAMADPAEDADAAYTRVITERADKIVLRLEIPDSDTTIRVRNLIVAQYRALGEIHDARDAKIEEAKQAPGGDSSVSEAFIGVVRGQAQTKMFELHRRFVAQLEAELSPEDVNVIKDGLTYGVVPITYNRYLAVLPDLTDVQKAEVLALLLEAREYAMDAGSSEEKHWWFGKYKGKINNYLSAQGYDLKQAEKQWSERNRTGGNGGSGAL